MKSPKNRILVAVTGLAPQVVTETLYSLVVQKDFVPTEVHLLTTSVGKQIAIKKLLPVFHDFCAQYKMKEKIRFDDETIHAVTNKLGKPLDDILTPEDNSDAADFISEKIRKFCSVEDSIVHVSIAGGRKSMGFLVGAAMSIYGRPQDQLSHVLVSEEYENLRDFYYPTQKKQTIVDIKSGQKLQAIKARISLAEIPFVRFRVGLPEDLQKGEVSYSETVRVLQAQVSASVSLSFDSSKCVVYCGPTMIKLSPAEFATLLWMAVCRKRNMGKVRPESESHGTEYIKAYSLVAKNSQDIDAAKAVVRSDTEFLSMFQTNRTKLHRKIERLLTPYGAKNYLIVSEKERVQKYELATPPELINLPSSSYAHE